MRTRRPPDIGITSRGHCWTGRRKPERGQRIPAVALESLVVRRIRDWLADPVAILQAVQHVASDAASPKAADRVAREILQRKTVTAARRPSAPLCAQASCASKSTWNALISCWIRIRSVGALTRQPSKTKPIEKTHRGQSATDNAVHSCSPQTHGQGDADHRRAMGRSPQLPTPALCVFSSVPTQSGISFSRIEA